MSVGVTMASWERIAQVYRSNKHNFHRIQNINSCMKALLHPVIFNIKKYYSNFYACFLAILERFPIFPIKLH